MPDAEAKCNGHIEKISAASEKYQSCMKTAPARGSAEAADPTERGRRTRPNADIRDQSNSTMNLRFGRFRCPALSDTGVYLALALIARFVVRALPWTYHTKVSSHVVNFVSAA